jgi:hypothetical protein
MYKRREQQVGVRYGDNYSICTQIIVHQLR